MPSSTQALLPPESGLWMPPAFGLDQLLRSRSCREPLEPLDLRALAFLATRLGSAPMPTRAECSLAELAAAVYGRPPGGSDRRTLESSLHRLEAAVVTLHGCDLVAGRLSRGVTRAPLFRAVAIESGPARLRYEFSPWLAGAVAQGGFPRLDLSILRALPTTAARLWALLEGGRGFEPYTETLELHTLRLDGYLHEALALGHAREAEARRCLRQAAAQVAGVDPRYARLEVRLIRSGWVLRVERRIGTAPYDHATRADAVRAARKVG
jgi:hypothetical protein